MPDIKVRVGQQNAVKVVASAFGGSLTAESAVNATNVKGGIASVTSIINSGITTLTGPVGLGSDLKVTGLSTFTGIVTTSSDLYVGGDLYVADDITLDEVNLRNLNVTGVSTLGITSATWLESEQLNVTGVSTFAGISTFSSNVFVEATTDTNQLNVSGLSTFVGVVTTSNDLYVGGDLYVLDDLVLDNITGNSLKITGLSTFVGHVGLSTGLTVAGVTTFNQDVQFPGAAYNILWDQATSKFKFDDSAQLVFGSASGGDMKLFHQSGNSTIRNETGQFRIAGNDIRLQTQNHSEDYLLAVDGGSVSIFHNDVKRLETTASGVDITDTLNVAGVSTFVGVVTTSNDLYVGGDLYVADDITLDEVTATSLNITGVSTFAGDAQFNGNVSIAGTLTYEDVTNVDSVGIITAGKGFRATTGGLIVTAGVSTFGAIATFTQNVFVDGTLTAGLIDGGSF